MKMNPVVEEIMKIQLQWNNLLRKEYPGVKLFRWIGQKLELQMVDGFIKTQMSPQTHSKDTFLMFTQPFEKRATYGQSIINDINEFIGNWFETKDNTFKQEKWQITEAPTASSIQIPDFPYFIKNINLLVSYFSLDEDAYLILTFTPSNISNVKQFQYWLLNLINSKDLHPQIKCMIYDLEGQAMYPLIANDKQKNILHIKPDINMDECIQATVNQVAMETKDPAAEFQKWLVRASFLIGKNKIDEAMITSNKSIAISQKHKWPELEVAARILRTNAWISQKEKEKSLAEIDIGIRVAGDDKALNLQSRILKATIYITDGDYAEAAKVYEECFPFLDQDKDPNWYMEIHRMYAFCIEKAGDEKKAWNSYLECLETGKLMDKEKVRITTLPFVGESMLQICNGHGYNRKDLNQEFESILGENWLNLTKRPMSIQ